MKMDIAVIAMQLALYLRRERDWLAKADPGVEQAK